MPVFPKPNRSNVKHQLEKTADNDVLDIGWAEGTLVDGRPFRAECWAQGHVTVLTFFFSTKGLEHATQGQLKEFLVESGVVAFAGSAQYAEGAPLLDAAGNEMWSVNVVVGDDDNLFVKDSVAIVRYAVASTSTGAP